MIGQPAQNFTAENLVYVSGGKNTQKLADSICKTIFITHPIVITNFERSTKKNLYMLFIKIFMYTSVSTDTL